MRSATIFVRTYGLVIVVVLALQGCHFGSPSNHQLQSAAEHATLAAGDAALNPSHNAGPPLIPRTGQKTTYAVGDDGDQRTGRTWPGPRFGDNGDGTVTDFLTGLMWTSNADQGNGTIDWEEALIRSRKCSEGAYGDWRLPNRNELESLLDLGQYQPALPAHHPFSNVQSAYYWTSTTPANSDDHAWIVHFFIGAVMHDDKAGTHYLWFVRSPR